MKRYDLEREYYNRLSDYEDRVIRRGFLCPQALVNYLAPHIREYENAIDVGCGTGLVGKALGEAGWTGTLLGIDVSETMLAQARSRPIYSSVAQMDAHNLALRSHRFDVVMSCAMIGITGYESVLEIRRLVRPGGIFACVAGYIKSIPWTQERFEAARRILASMFSRELKLIVDLGSGYDSDYDDESYTLYILKTPRESVW